MNKIALNAVACDFPIDYGLTYVKNILHIKHKKTYKIDYLQKNKT